VKSDFLTNLRQNEFGLTQIVVAGSVATCAIELHGGSVATCAIDLNADSVATCAIDLNGGSVATSR
jgi:hypothetical protein